MPKRATPLILAALLAGCASTPEAAEAVALPERSPAAIADTLADATEVRASPNRMRVLVHFRRPDDPGLAVIAPELERELVTALSGRFHLFDPGPAATSGTPPTDLDELVQRLDVTHALLCDIARKDGEVELSLRLLEHSTRRIVATAQGTFPLDALTDSNRVALSRAPAPVSAARSAPSAVPEPLEVASSAPSTGLPERLYEGARNRSTTPTEFVPLDPAPSAAAPVAAAAGPVRAEPLAAVDPPLAEIEQRALPSPPLASPKEPEGEPGAIVQGPAAARLQALGIDRWRR